jgi:hypothetical protein
MIDIFYNEKPSFQEKLVSDMNVPDIIHDIRRSISLSSSTAIYIAVSFLTDQFHVLKKHWKKM